MSLTICQHEYWPPMTRLIIPNSPASPLVLAPSRWSSNETDPPNEGIWQRENNLPLILLPGQCHLQDTAAELESREGLTSLLSYFMSS